MCPCGTFLVCANQMRFFLQINPDFKKLPPVVKRYLQLWKEEISSSIWRPRPIPPRSNTNGPKMETVERGSQSCQKHCQNLGKGPSTKNITLEIVGFFLLIRAFRTLIFSQICLLGCLSLTYKSNLKCNINMKSVITFYKLRKFNI